MDEAWPKEDIPDVDSLYMRVHVNNTTNGELNPGAFCDKGAGMSTNWKKYCETAEQARQKAKDPSKNGVVELGVKDVRAVPPLIVEHTPDLERRDRSHTDVFGRKDPEVRMKLLRVAQWAIRVST